MLGADLILFPVLNVNRVSSSVVNAVLKGGGVVYGTHNAIFLLPLFALSNLNQRLVIRGRTA
jgi:hypothetical protein